MASRKRPPVAVMTAVLLAVLAVLASACGARPATVSKVPSVPPTGSLVPTSVPEGAAGQPSGVCVQPHRQAASPGGGLVTVDLHPTGAVLAWLPGLNSPNCASLFSRASPATAQRLAIDIRSAPKAPTGPIDCPSDDGAGVTVYFTYTGRSGAEVVTIGFTGCGSVGAPGARSRSFTTALAGDLRPLTPPAWARYVR